MLRVSVLLFVLQVCEGAKPVTVSTEEKNADLQALDLADQDLAARLPVNKDIKLEKPKVPKAPKKALRHKVHQQHPRNEPLPDEKTKSSVLWAHDREMKFADEAAKVLEVGDKAAEAKIEEEKEAAVSHVAPAKVVHVSEEEAAEARKAPDDALEGAHDMEQDLKDLKERAVEEKEEQQEEETAAEKRKWEADEKNVTKIVEKKPEKKADLDHLMKLSAQMKSDAGRNNSVLQKSGVVFAQEAPATADHRFNAMKNLAESVRKARAKADEPEPVVTMPSAPKKGEMTADKVQRLKQLAGKMQDAAKSQAGAGPKVVEESAEQAAADEGELVEGEQMVAIPQGNFSAPQAPKYSTKFTAPTVAGRSFKGSSLKNEVKQSAKDFHNKIADHVVNMHAALRDHALEMENKAKQAKLQAQEEAAERVKQAEDAARRQQQEAEQAAIAAQKEAEDRALREKAERVQQENSVAFRAHKAMAEQAAAEASDSNSQQKYVSKSELKARDDAHQKMLDYRIQQKKERAEQKREKDLIAKDALEAEQAAQTLRELENELPKEEAPPKKKSGAAVPASFGCFLLAILLAAH